MTKDEAQREAIRRWRSLPVMARQTQAQAEGFAEAMENALEFRTMGNRRRMIASWLIRDLGELEAAVRVAEQKTKAA